MYPIGTDWRSALVAIALAAVSLGALAVLARLSSKLQGPEQKSADR
jgi:hypothetical protein